MANQFLASRVWTTNCMSYVDVRQTSKSLRRATTSWRGDWKSPNFTILLTWQPVSRWNASTWLTDSTRAAKFSLLRRSRRRKMLLRPTTTTEAAAAAVSSARRGRSVRLRWTCRWRRRRRSWWRAARLLSCASSPTTVNSFVSCRSTTSSSARSTPSSCRILARSSSVTAGWTTTFTVSA